LGAVLKGRDPDLGRDVALKVLREDFRDNVDMVRIEIWACCLMPDHVHLIAVPQSVDGLARAIGEVHRRYTRDDDHVITAVSTPEYVRDGLRARPKG
jgi:REP element-mobilizing transposase RayT